MGSPHPGPRMRLSVGIYVGATLAAIAACSDATGPIGDLTTLGSDLNQISVVLASPIPWAAGWTEYGLHLPTADTGSPLIPDSLRGKTLTLNCTTYTYAPGPDTGAPATAVRIVVYQRGANGSLPCPPVAIGHFDLYDVSTPGDPAIRAQVTDLVGDPPLIDVTVNRTGFGSTLTTGFVGDGAHRLELNVFTDDSLPFIPQLQWQITVAGTGIQEVLGDTVWRGVDTYSDDFHLSLSDGPRAARLDGGFGWFNTLSSWSAKVSVDAAPFANVSGNTSSPVITPTNPIVRFTSQERAVFLQIVNTPGVLHSMLGGILAVPAQLMPR